MENSAYNRNIANQINAINQRYIKEAERRGHIIEDMPITRDSVRGLQGAGFWSDFGSGFVKGFQMPFQAVSKLVGGELPNPFADEMAYLKNMKRGGIQTGGGFLDDFATGFALPFKAVTKLVGGEKKPRGRPRKMAGGFFDDVLGGVQSAIKLAPLLGLGKGRKMAGISTGGIGTGGISTGGRRKKMTKEGAGFLNDVIGIATKVAPLALALGKPKRGRKAKKMGGEIALNLREEDFDTPSQVGNMPYYKSQVGIPTGGRRHRKMGGIGTGGISTGGLSRKLLGARAVGSGYAELEGSGYSGNGFFDDVLEGIGNVGKLVDKGLDIGDKLGLLKKGKGKMAKKGGIGTGGISTGGKRGASKWVEHVKAFAKKHNISYKDALKQAKASYRA